MIGHYYPFSKYRIIINLLDLKMKIIHISIILYMLYLSNALNFPLGKSR